MTPKEAVEVLLEEAMDGIGNKLTDVLFNVIDANEVLRDFIRENENALEALKRMNKAFYLEDGVIDFAESKEYKVEDFIKDYNKVLKRLGG